MTITDTTNATETILVREEPAYAGPMTALAGRVGVKVPDLSVEVQVPVQPTPSPAAVEPAAPGMTDPATIRAFLKTVRGRSHGSSVNADMAAAAAKRLGTDGLLKLVSRSGAKARGEFASVAFHDGWLTPSIEVLDALSLTPADRLGLVQSALYHARDAGIDLATPSELTAWVFGDSPTGLADAARLWSSRSFPEGVIDDDVVLGLSRNHSRGMWISEHSATPRLSDNVVDVIVADTPEFAGMMLAFSVNLSAKRMVKLYDLVADFNADDEYLETGIRPDTDRVLLALALNMAKSGYTTKAVIDRVRDFLSRANEPRYSNTLGEFLLTNTRCSEDELARFLTLTGFINWLDGEFPKNQPKRAVALRLVTKWDLRELIKRAEMNHSDQLAHPERYEWFIDMMTTTPGIPNSTRQAMRNTLRIERPGVYGTGVTLRAAAKAFSAAPKPVQTRLWRSLASETSLFDDRDASFASVTAEFMERSAKAAARVAARSGASA